MDEPWKLYAKWKITIKKSTYCIFHSYEMSSTSKSIKTESRYRQKVDLRLPKFQADREVGENAEWLNE